MTIIKFTVPGEPTAKGRARAFVRAGRVGHHTPEKTARYESLVALTAQQAMAGIDPSTGPVVLDLLASFSIPASWSQKKQRAAAAGELHHTSRPDLDNVVKAIKDGCNGVVWKDDSQVCSLAAAKRYSTTPGVIVEVNKA